KSYPRFQVRNSSRPGCVHDRARVKGPVCLGRNRFRRLADGLLQPVQLDGSILHDRPTVATEEVVANSCGSAATPNWGFRSG
ncbi:MAG TPA: hypothetical protein VKF38_15405, partial [Anaerolineaceae bacterium]|nr:hypothetical protein [Anaerolineaceae bacterium]